MAALAYAIPSRWPHCSERRLTPSSTVATRSPDFLIVAHICRPELNAWGSLRLRWASMHAIKGPRGPRRASTVRRRQLPGASYLAPTSGCHAPVARNILSPCAHGLYAAMCRRCRLLTHGSTNRIAMHSRQSHIKGSQVHVAERCRGSFVLQGRTQTEHAGTTAAGVGRVGVPKGPVDPYSAVQCRTILRLCGHQAARN